MPQLQIILSLKRWSCRYLPWVRLAGTNPLTWKTMDPSPKVSRPCLNRLYLPAGGLFNLTPLTVCGAMFVFSKATLVFLSRGPQGFLVSLRPFRWAGKSKQSHIYYMVNGSRVTLPFQCRRQWWATLQVTDIFTGADMSRDGIIDCLGYLSMPLSPSSAPP